MTFDGVRPVLQLPFTDDADQAIVASELRALAGAMIDEGADGLVILGLGSESWAVTETERDHAVAATFEAIDGRVPLVVGLDGTTAVAVDRGRRAAAAGAVGLMVLPPRQAVGRSAIVSHYATLADAAGIAILVQDSPQLTGVNLDLETIVALTEAHPLITSLKVEIPGAGAKTSAAHEAGVEIVAGWGGLGYPEQVARGAVGCMPGSDLGPAIKHIDVALRLGDSDAAWSLYECILPLLAFETVSLDRILLGAKRHLRRRGLFTSEVLRAPARTLDPVESVTVDALLDELAAHGVPGFGRLA